MIEVLLYISKFSKKQQKDASPEQVTNFRHFSCENAETMTKFGLNSDRYVFIMRLQTL